MGTRHDQNLAKGIGVAWQELPVQYVVTNEGKNKYPLILRDISEVRFTQLALLALQDNNI